MFERYTQSARRAVFFARYEALKATASSITTVDLLRGIVRESKPEAQRIEWIRANWDRLYGALWPDGSGQSESRPRSGAIKLSEDAKLSLAYAAQVASGNPRGMIDAPTLLLGILSFENEASQMLQRLGLDLENARNEVRELHSKFPPELPTWRALSLGKLRVHRLTLLKVLIFFIVVYAGLVLLNGINR